MDALRRQRGRGWQAAVTVVLLPHKLLRLVKLQASPGWSLLPVPSSLHPIHPPSLLGLPFYPLFFLICFFLLFHMLSHLHISSDLVSFHSSFTVTPQLPPFFLLSTSPFIERLKSQPEDIRRLQLNAAVLSALVAGHSSIYDSAPNSVHFEWNCWCFRVGFNLNRLDLQRGGCSVQLKLRNFSFCLIQLSTVLSGWIRIPSEKELCSFVGRILIHCKIVFSPTLVWRRTKKFKIKL